MWSSRLCRIGDDKSGDGYENKPTEMTGHPPPPSAAFLGPDGWTLVSSYSPCQSNMPVHGVTVGKTGTAV